MGMRHITFLAVLFFAGSAHADDPARGAFDRNLAIGAYGSGWAGSYLGASVGGRARWEPFESLGIDLFAEHMWVRSPGGFRHDHPIGFNAYIPFDLGQGWRFRPLLGFCAVFSMIEPDNEDAPRADDVLFGMHAGAGVEWAPLRLLSLFVDLKAIGYLGHDRTAQGWTGSVSEDYATMAVVQANLGAQVHFDL
jgi:hypothetical protein